MTSFPHKFKFISNRFNNFKKIQIFGDLLDTKWKVLRPIRLKIKILKTKYKQEANRYKYQNTNLKSMRSKLLI